MEILNKTQRLNARWRLTGMVTAVLAFNTLIWVASLSAYEVVGTGGRAGAIDALRETKTDLLGQISHTSKEITALNERREQIRREIRNLDIDKRKAQKEVEARKKEFASLRNPQQ